LGFRVGLIGAHGEGMRLLLSLVMLTACNFQLGTSTNGDSGNARFEYGACLFGCKVNQAMMTGTSEIIRVTGSSIPAIHASSTATSVMSVGAETRECCTQKGACRTITASDVCATGETASLSITVITKTAGSAELVLDQNGTTFDSVTLTVADPKSLVVACGNKPGSTTLPRNQECGLTWTARDASGNALMATTGVTMITTDATVADFATGLLGEKSSSVTATQGLFGTSIATHAAGEATITATANGASAQYVVDVAP
jgi:hypothetical protein